MQSVEKSCGNDGEHLKTIDSVNIANYQFKKFLSPSAWSSLSSLDILQKALPDDLTLNVMFSPSSGKQFPSTLTKLPTSFYTFPFQNLSSIMLQGVRLPNLAPVGLYTCRNMKVHSILGYFLISQSTTYTSCESLRSISFSTASYLTIIKKTSTNHIINQYWLFSLSLLKLWPEQWLCFQPGQQLRRGQQLEQ